VLLLLTDKLELLTGAAGQLLAATPTSPMEAQAEGALTPVRKTLVLLNLSLFRIM